jgi:hypothetical protein
MSVLKEIGNLDDTFFMYGEDIDLSYRIIKAGYSNAYLADTSIIHYKGESTKKSSVNYVVIFYKAMVIFARKHFSNKGSNVFSILINFAIYVRATLALAKRFIQRITLPTLDFLYVFIGLYALTFYWERANIDFPAEIFIYGLPSYALTWVITAYFHGAYDKPANLFSTIKGVAIGTILILIVYGVLPKSLQFSRLFIFIGAAWVGLYYILSRFFLHFANPSAFGIFRNRKKTFAVIADSIESNRIQVLLSKFNDDEQTVERFDSLKQINRIDQFDEVIFSSKTNQYMDIIDSMSELGKHEIQIKIAPPNVEYLIGSNSIDTAGDLYILNLNELKSKSNIRKKRLFDLIFSLIGLILLPLVIFSFKKKNKYLINLLGILFGRISFVGFLSRNKMRDVRLPNIKEGVLNPADILSEKDDAIVEKLNLLYARDYSMRKDFSILYKSWKQLDR